MKLGEIKSFSKLENMVALFENNLVTGHGKID